MAGDPFTAAIFRWLNAVAADSTLPPAAFKLAYVISQHINRKSLKAWPSQATLKEAIGVKDERSVRRLTDALEERGYLLTRRRKQTSMVYLLAQDRTELSYQATDNEAGNGSRPDENDRSSDQDRTFDAPRPDIPVHQDRPKLSAKPPIEPPKKPERERARATRIADDFSLDDHSYNQALEQLGSVDAVTTSLSRFRDHHRGRGTTSVDWQATARLWIGDDVRSGRYRAAPTSESRGAHGPTEAAWRDVLSTWVSSKHRRWTAYTTDFGPDPSSPECRVPPHLLEEYGLARSAA